MCEEGHAHTCLSVFLFAEADIHAQAVITLAEPLQLPSFLMTIALELAQRQQSLRMHLMRDSVAEGAESGMLDTPVIFERRPGLRMLRLQGLVVNGILPW